MGEDRRDNSEAEVARCRRHASIAIHSRKTCASTIPSISRLVLPPQVQQGSLSSTEIYLRVCRPGEDDGHGRVSQGKDCSVRCVGFSRRARPSHVASTPARHSRLWQGRTTGTVGCPCLKNQTPNVVINSLVCQPSIAGRAHDAA